MSVKQSALRQVLGTAGTWRGRVLAFSFTGAGAVAAFLGDVSTARFNYGVAASLRTPRRDRPEIGGV